MLGAIAPSILVLACVLALGGCGSRTSVLRSLDAGASTEPTAERCNGLDDDGEKGVDDPFRDALGRYVTDAHCGACNQPCAPRTQTELETHCQVIGEVPRCMAARCAAGSGPSREGRCIPLDERLCLPCASENDCGALAGARCAPIGGEQRCTFDCALGCPSGYDCDALLRVCVPRGGSCTCTAGESFDVACPAGGKRQSGEPVCVGRARCEGGVLSACATRPEVCDHDDNDCDGQVDEGFADERGAYSRDPANCGECGVSCVEETGTDLELTCGGDPFAPRCTLACPDARDGLQVGDLLDGDLEVATGCECRVTATHDAPGPRQATGEALDVNCDGADGDVLNSIYVAPDGDDGWAGSPTRPLRTLTVAVQRARASLDTDAPRPHVYVAAGTYTEALVLADGVFVHGGYRRDFRMADPAAFVVEVRAPSGGTTPYGAALVGREVGARSTVVEGMQFRGLDAAQPEAATLGAFLERPGPQLVLRDLVIRAGLPGEGRMGADGAAGSAPTTPPGTGAPPRAALEGPEHDCLVGAANLVSGGVGGVNGCAGRDVRGGAGGAAGCPVGITGQQGAGERGQNAGGAGGAGGVGGQDAEGPIRGAGCNRDVCCGLADFTVPSDFTGPGAGENGRDGSPGMAGAGCGQSRGSFRAGSWSASRGSAGSAGLPGGGGGGGGAGGGVRMIYVQDACMFVDGLGGGGGGGGAGGCGGTAGSEGTSGGASVALLVIEAGAFSMEGVSLEPASGARGGPGGAGGDGGPGGTGAVGGSVPPESRTTPTLAGTYPGARGGTGGTGGAGGGGGGGCGGSSVGLWIVGAEPTSAASWRSQNRFALGAGGDGGAGGGGAQAGGSGARGEALDVVVEN